MKKLFMLVLVVLFVALMPMTALATPFYLESAGVTIEVPDGMSAEDQSDDVSAMLVIADDADPAVKYVYSVTYLEEYEGLWMEDLTDEQGNALLEGFRQGMTNPQFNGAEQDGISYVIAANEDGTQLHLVALLNGWLCDVAAVSADALGDAAIDTAIGLLLGITFDE